MHKLERELRAMAPKVRYLNNNLGDELLSLAELSHNYVKDVVFDASAEPSESDIVIDDEEEIEYIVNNCSDKKCTYDRNTQLLCEVCNREKSDNIG